MKALFANIVPSTLTCLLCWWGLEYADCIPQQRGNHPPSKRKKSNVLSTTINYM